jgi:hypothetical protein
VNESPTGTTRVERVTEVAKVEEPVIERGGYSAGKRTVSELPPPPPSVTVQDTAKSGGAPTANQTSAASSTDSSK